MIMNFNLKKSRLEKQFEETEWISGSGISKDELIRAVNLLKNSFPSKMIIKAKTFELIANKAKIAVDRDDIFQDKLFGAEIMRKQRNAWEEEIKKFFLKEEDEQMCRAWQDFGAYRGQSDFGHTSPNTRLLLNVGFTGLLDNVEKESQKHGLTESQKVFYQSCKTVLTSVITVAKRLAEAIKPYSEENSRALLNIANGKPENSYEAMQLLILYFFIHEYVCGARVRTLGRLDVLLFPFYQNDIDKGIYTKDEIKEML